MQQSHTHHFIPVDILTVSYRVVGKMMVSNTGIIGLLNNPNSSFMEIHDARLARIHMPTKLADHFEVIRLTKTHLLIVSLNRREDIGPQALARAGYATTNQYEALVTMQNYEAEGSLEWQGRFDFRVLMAEGTRDFVPLYNAKVTGVLIPTLKIQSPVMLFNRQQVDLLGLLNQRKDDKE
ncbi:MAG: hypothetical protein HN392_02520 [Anaerolineae bacterium]|jgi:hypothetical protein|nr:hypothetical protein [Anaerolineae bacterium]MBT7075042.1 hypothetical protein [Anaerolineae bacterium]MBT7782845.1 hypothetical protein [Anaerolineae bacterium]